MIPIAGGVFAFLCFLIYDWNSVCVKSRILHKTFLLGCLILFGITIIQIREGIAQFAWQGWRVTFLLAGAIFFILLCYTLFFALPFQKTYGEAEGKNEIYDKGVYALCRHPGVLWFFFFYLCVGVAFLPTPLLRNGMIYSGCNLLYIWFQDIWTFPRTFQGYEAYKKTTPFLLPNKQSIHRAFQSVYLK